MSYYYLIASLPDISPIVDTSRIDYDETFERIKRNLTAEDEKLFRYLIYPNDLQNLLSVLFHEYQDIPITTFKKPFFIDLEEIKAYRFTKGNFPDFMNDFIVENEDRFPNMSMREMEEAMLDSFYMEVSGLNNDFLSDYFSFDRELKALVAAFHFNAYSFLSQPNIQDADRLIGQLGPQRSASTSLAKDYLYLDGLIKVLSEEEPEKIVRYIDNILWNFLEERYEGSFSREEVFAYTVKLQITQRWLTLDQKTGDERFEKLHDKIIKNVRSPKTSVI